MNAIDIPISELNNVFCIFVKMYTRMNEKFFMYANHKKSLLTKKKAPARKTSVCILK